MLSATELLPRAAAIGEQWALECATTLRASDRDCVGGWPGTLREARSLVITRMSEARSPAADAELLQQLTHATYEAARKSWQAFCVPDDEP